MSCLQCIIKPVHKHAARALSEEQIEYAVKPRNGSFLPDGSSIPIFANGSSALVRLFLTLILKGRLISLFQSMVTTDLMVSESKADAATVFYPVHDNWKLFYRGTKRISLCLKLIQDTNFPQHK